MTEHISEREALLIERFLDIFENISLELRRQNDLKEKEMRNIGTGSKKLKVEIIK